MALFAKHEHVGSSADVAAGGRSPSEGSPSWELHGGIGSRLMHKAGWRPGQGLGRHGDGMAEPIAATLRLDRTCVGHPDAKALDSEKAEAHLNYSSPPARGRAWSRGGRMGSRRGRRGGGGGVHEPEMPSPMLGDIMSPRCRWCNKRHSLRALQKHEAKCHRLVQSCSSKCIAGLGAVS